MKNPFRNFFASRVPGVAENRLPDDPKLAVPPVNLNPLNQPTIPTTPNGWIFCKDGQPAFDTQVEVLALAEEPVPGVEDKYVLGLGRRTREPVASRSGGFQERWHCVFLKYNSGLIVAWRTAPSERL